MEAVALTPQHLHKLQVPETKLSKIIAGVKRMESRRNKDPSKERDYRVPVRVSHVAIG